MKSILRQSILLSLILGSSSAFVSPASTSSTCNTANAKPPSTAHRFDKPRFVQGASPSIGRNGLPLFAKKKKDPTAGKSGKIQVKLLKHIAGTGSAGDVIMVAPAFFANKLQKTGSAVKITDEEVQKGNAEKAENEADAKALANDLKEKFAEIALDMPRKVGPDGKLFGGISYKCIMTELNTLFPKGALGAKYIKITDVKDEEGTTLKHDIKSVGEYSATIQLLKDVSADFKISVTSE